MAKVSFNWTNSTKRTDGEVIVEQSNYYNLKNKAEGPRRIAFAIRVVSYDNGEGQVAYEGWVQTTLGGSPYQSRKYTAKFDNAQEAHDDALRMVRAALKRYAKLAQSPGLSKIEAR